jgi:hypothetical protein
VPGQDAARNLGRMVASSYGARDSSPRSLIKRRARLGRRRLRRGPSRRVGLRNTRRSLRRRTCSHARRSAIGTVDLLA